MIIGSDLMNELNIDLLFSENKIHIGTEQSGYDSIPMKKLGTSHDIETCKLMYDLHTESSLLQLEEARQDKLLDANYSRVDIDNMVQDLDIARDSKRKLKSSLNKYK